MIYAQKFETMDSFFKFITTAQITKFLQIATAAKATRRDFLVQKTLRKLRSFSAMDGTQVLKKSRQGSGETLQAQRLGRLCVTTMSGLAHASC